MIVLNSLLLVLPVPFLRKGNELYVESQAGNGLDRWADNFDWVTVACPTIPVELADNDPNLRWKPVSKLANLDRLELIELPWAYHPWRFLNTYSRTWELLRQHILCAQYLSFAIGGLIGDWASIACIVADRMGRKYSVWTDRVEFEVIRHAIPSMPMLKGLYRRLQLPIMERYHHRMIRRSSLGLFHGSDCYQAFSPYSTNPHCVHNIHLKKRDRISNEELEGKCSALLKSCPLRICYFGRTDLMKGPSDWLDVLSRSLDQGVSLRATWFGDGLLRESMQNTVEDRQLASTIRFPGFCDDRQHVLHHIREHDIFLFCHKTPESPRGLIEALAQGTPIVGYQSPYSKDITREHGGSVLVPMNDRQALVEAIVTLDRDRTRLVELTRQAAKSGESFNDEDVFRIRSDLIKKYLSDDFACETK